MDADTPQILIVDDARDIREPLAQFLRRNGYRVRLAASVDEARAVLAKSVIHLIVLDIMMPGGSGLDLLRELRRGAPPALLLSARTAEEQIVEGLELGAEDYITKPFGPRELLARIAVVLRRWPPVQPEAPQVPRAFAGHVYDPARCIIVGPRGNEIALTTGEGRLLDVLLDNANQPVSRERLMDLIWGREAKAYDRTVDNIISRLRRKLGDDGRKPTLITTQWGGGYRLMSDIDPLGD